MFHLKLANVPARFWLWRHMHHQHTDLTKAVWTCSCGSSFEKAQP